MNKGIINSFPKQMAGLCYLGYNLHSHFSLLMVAL